MSTLLVIKNLALKMKDEYLKKSMRLLDSYLEKHGNAKIRTYIEDNCVSIYDGQVFLLKVSTAMLNVEGGEDNE